MPLVPRVFIGMFLAASLMACGDEDPGALAGTWQMNDVLTNRPLMVTFRRGETESLGVIDPVTYRVEGHDVLLTYTDGLAKGSSLRYTVVDTNTAQSPLGVLRRVR